jgi:hypothetical protein
MFLFTKGLGMDCEWIVNVQGGGGGGRARRGAEAASDGAGAVAGARQYAAQ